MPTLNIKISDRERRILMLAAVVAAVFIASYVLPAIVGIYEQRQANIEAVYLDIDREARLIEGTTSWRARRIAVESRRGELASQVFSGATIPLVEATIQRELTRHARESGIDVNSTRLAERLRAGGWIMISQEMSFRTNNAGNTISFLEALANGAPRLYVKDFSLDRNRQQYMGSITVVGFARSEGLVADNGDD